MLSLAPQFKLEHGSRLLFWVLILNIAVAIDTLFFWVGFFSETSFPIKELRPLINNFDGYYAWERCFVVPDTILACATLLASYQLLRNQTRRQAFVLLSACAGAWIFLGVLDFTYGITNGMYTLGHPFSYVLLSIGVGLPIMGTFTLWALNKIDKENKV